MIKIDFPSFDFKTKNENNKEFIFDPVRKLWVALTPEEWVRQNFMQYLLQVKNYSAALMAIEKEIQLGELSKRCDIVVYNREALPWLMVECKSMNVALTESVLNQVLRYNLSIPVRYLIITNGTYSLGFERKELSVEPLLEIPSANLI